MKPKLPLSRRIQLGFVAVVVLLLIVDGVAYRSVTASSDSARWVQHTGEVLQHLAVLRSAMENIETGYRDFALSGDDAFLQASRTMIPLADQEQSTLRALTADNLVEQRRLAVIADLVQRIILRGDNIVRSRRAEGIASAVDVIRRGHDDPVLDEFRSVAGDMQNEERRLLHERNANEERRYRQSNVALLLGS